MRKVFISYARANRAVVGELAEHLRDLGCDPWIDLSLHGGQDWWQEILRRIADCDVFIPIISREALNSEACKREFDWAEALRKPVLPVAVQPLPVALPRRLGRRQIVDYSAPAERERAARKLGGGLYSLPPAPPLPIPAPPPPDAPLSYLTDLVELVSGRSPIGHDQQLRLVGTLSSALRSVDPDERRGARDVLDRFSSRNDVYADVDRMIAGLKHTDATPAPRNPPGDRPPPRAAPLARPQQAQRPAPSGPARRVPAPVAAAQPRNGFSRADLVFPAVLFATAAVIGTIPPIVALRARDGYPDRIWLLQTAARILIGLAFWILAQRARSFPTRSVTRIGILMAPVILAHVINHVVILGIAPNASLDRLSHLTNVVVYPTLLGLTSAVAIAFGVAVVNVKPAPWAVLLIGWGLCGLVEAAMSYVAKTVDGTAATADTILIVQNLLLLTVAALMFRKTAPQHKVESSGPGAFHG